MLWRRLPAIMREGLVRLGHAMRVFALLDRAPRLLRGIHQFARQTFLHGIFGAGRVPRRSASGSPAPGCDPCGLRPAPDRSRRRRGASAPRPPAAHCSARRGRRAAAPARRAWRCARRRRRRCVSAAAFLPWYIRQFMNLVRTSSPNLASGMTSRLTAARRRDIARSLYFGRLAPYFERRWRRSLTPCVSSVPRMM